MKIDDAGILAAKTHSRMGSRVHHRCRVFRIGTPIEASGVEYFEVWDTLERPAASIPKGEKLFDESAESQRSVEKKIQEARKAGRIPADRIVWTGLFPVG